MAKPKQAEPKVILTREYIVPLRKEWLKVPEYKRANKATKALKQFLAKHMKVYDRDLRKIKLDVDLNNELRFKGMRKPLGKIKVKANKFDNGIVRVVLVNIPKHIQFKQARILKKKAELMKKALKKEPVKKEEKVKEEESNEAKEKEKASRDEGLKEAKKEAKNAKHTSKEKNVIIHPKKLSR
jgi:ribosomal protein L31E